MFGSWMQHLLAGVSGFVFDCVDEHVYTSTLEITPGGTHIYMVYGDVPLKWVACFRTSPKNGVGF